MDKEAGKVFKFYSKQQQLIGKSPTFEMIQNNANTFTKGKFLKFCKDFKIALTKDEALSIFNKVTDFCSEMSLEQFKNALNELKGDKTIKQFYEFLEFNNPKKLRKKCTPFSKKHLLSLPELPFQLLQKKKILTTRSTKDITNSIPDSNNTKLSTASKKSYGSSNLPSSAIYFPVLNKAANRGNSYNCIFRERKRSFRH